MRQDIGSGHGGAVGEVSGRRKRNQSAPDIAAGKTDEVAAHAIDQHGLSYHKSRPDKLSAAEIERAASGRRRHVGRGGVEKRADGPNGAATGQAYDQSENP